MVTHGKTQLESFNLHYLEIHVSTEITRDGGCNVTMPFFQRRNINKFNIPAGKSHVMK
jgi:hypothetical protein